MKKYSIGTPVLNSGKVFYPVVEDDLNAGWIPPAIYDYFMTREDAKQEADRLNYNELRRTE